MALTEKELIKARVAYYTRNLEPLKIARKAQDSWPERGALLRPTTIADGVPCEAVGIPAECMQEILKIAEEKTSLLLQEYNDRAAKTGV